MLTIIVPTRNEAANIPVLLQRLASALDAIPFTVLFVDDSTDQTPQRIADLAATSAFPIQLIARPLAQRNGLSGAVVEGFRAAQTEWMCVMDADLQHPPEVIPALLARAREAGADVVVGSRQANWWGPRGLSRRRAITSQILTTIARAWFPRLLKNVSDPLTGLFLVRRTAVDINALRPDGFKILLELLIRCPGLRVSELHFDFAAREQGDSKADFREGVRYFRHLLLLRATANRSFPRLIATAVASLIGDTAVSLLLAQWLPYGWAIVAAAELFILLRFAITEKWVLGGGLPIPGWPSFGRFVLSNQLSLFLLRLPLVYGLVEKGGWPLPATAVVAILVEAVLRYILSEQFAFSPGGLGVWQRNLYWYDLHGLLRIQSQVKLPELAYFERPQPDGHTDIVIRVDRHGTPSPQPGAITYDEQLSRFGFGVAIMPGDFSEVVVSPALAHAPYALYKSILEPLLRWCLRQKGCVLLYGASVASHGRGQLLLPLNEHGKTEAVLTAVAAGAAFLADDFTILSQDGRLWSYPKPLTMTRPVLAATAVVSQLPWRLRWGLRLKNLIYSNWSRKRSLAMSRHRWPVASLNLYLQQLLPPPKMAVYQLFPQAKIVAQAPLTAVVAVDESGQNRRPLAAAEAIALIQQHQQASQGFPPYALLDQQLQQWQGQDGRAIEQALLQQAFAHLGQTAVAHPEKKPHGLP